LFAQAAQEENRQTQTQEEDAGKPSQEETPLAHIEHCP
jgi:hypothetical protein